MDDVILRISRHYLTGVVGILGLGAASYLIKRYLSNTEHTTNAYYTRMDELAHGANIAALAPYSRKVFIFWNGDFNSTYLLLDYLQQDYIIQPLYIERYTIRKALEHDLLEKYTSQYNQSKLSPSNAKCRQFSSEDEVPCRERSERSSSCPSARSSIAGRATPPPHQRHK